MSPNAHKETNDKGSHEQEETDSSSRFKLLSLYCQRNFISCGKTRTLVERARLPKRQTRARGHATEVATCAFLQPSFVQERRCVFRIYEHFNYSRAMNVSKIYVSGTFGKALEEFFHLERPNPCGETLGVRKNEHEIPSNSFDFNYSNVIKFSASFRRKTISNNVIFQ